MTSELVEKSSWQGFLGAGSGGARTVLRRKQWLNWERSLLFFLPSSLPPCLSLFFPSPLSVYESQRTILWNLVSLSTYFLWGGVPEIYLS